jgi:pimeloyl-ACP methyl ester carboxylesterase
LARCGRWPTRPSGASGGAELSAPAVVLVHGFAGSGRQTWAETGWLDLLADEGREAHPVDLLGHGQADKPHDPRAYAALADHLLAQLPDESVDAIGFSLGSQTLLQVAMADPSRFRRLVVAGIGDDVFDPPDAEPVAAMLMAAGEPPDGPEAGGKLPDDPFIRHLLDLVSEPDGDRDALAACLRRPRQPFEEAHLAAVTLPVLVVLGDRDHVPAPDRLVAALPDARLVTLRGIDHSATPRAMGFIDAALRFLAG